MVRCSMSSKPSLRVVPSKPQVWGQRCNDNTLAPFSEVPGSASAAVTWGAFSRHIRHKHFMIVSYDTLCIKNKDHLINSRKFRLNRCSCIEMYRKNTKCTIRQKASTRISKRPFHWIHWCLIISYYSSIYLLETFSTDHSVSHDSYSFNLVEIILRTKRCQNQLQLPK